jgi:hypothetical protein
MASVPTISPNRRGKSTHRPRIVKARKCTGLDNTAGATFASGYAIGGDGVGSLCHIKFSSEPTSPSEGGIVQNVPDEARVLLMGPLCFWGGCPRVPDYFAENIGRPNNLGNQSQDNCMLSRRSQHKVPSSNGFVFKSCIEQLRISKSKEKPP